MKLVLKQKKKAGHLEKRSARLASGERKALVRLISCGTALSNVAHNIRHDPGAGKWRQACQHWQQEWDYALALAQRTINKLRGDSRGSVDTPMMEKSK